MSAMQPNVVTRRRQPEKVEQASIVRLLKSIGADVYVSGTRRPRGDYQGTMQTPGIPDLEAFLPIRGTRTRAVLKVEVKAPGGRLSPAQVQYRALCEAAAVSHVVGGLSEVIAWLVRHGYVRDDQVPAYRLPAGK